VDLGISHLAVLSQPVAGVTAEQGMVANPCRLDEAQRRLRRISRRCSRRRGPDKHTQGDSAEPSKRWRKANATRRRLHTRVTNLRRDGIHKLATALAARFGAVVVEDLNVSGMLRNRRLARRIADAGFGEIRRQLRYKTTWRGGTLHVADRWFPSTKTCSDCGAVKAKLPLHVRVFACEHCGLSLDRDVNACADVYDSWRDIVAQHLRAAGVPDAEGLATVLVAAVEGALLLARTSRDITPLHTVGTHLRALLTPGRSSI
jgi:putative transposase